LDGKGMKKLLVEYEKRENGGKLKEANQEEVEKGWSTLSRDVGKVFKNKR